MFLKITLIMVILVSMLSITDSLKCYTCAGSKCTEMTCPPTADRCLKIETSEKGVFGKSCAPKAVCDVKGPFKTWCCEGDLCNGAGTIGKSLLLLLVPLASIFLLS
ncbi:ly-6/neurotoxin-like protein 1 [Sardina pilchardus]|uniref:ly-6/neurotoxin-like protein 1 n=1 Tax=Sardina pilchardus TaxID=27697 RepID=UPI002E0FD7BA